VPSTRSTAGGKALTAPLSVVMDPRVATPAAGLRQQHEMASRLAAMMNASFDAQAEVRALDHQLEALSAPAHP
jgi:hypothetical protein